MHYSDGKFHITADGICELALRGSDLDCRTQPIGVDRAENATEPDTCSGELTYGGVTFLITCREGRATLGESGNLRFEAAKLAGRLPSGVSDLRLAKLLIGGYLSLLRSDADRATLVLTFVSRRDGERCAFTLEKSREELYSDVCTYLAAVLPTARFMRDRREVTLAAARRDGRFPYPGLRDGQGELMSETYRAIKGGKRLFAQAPTGIGKTLSTLYPAVRALADGLCDRIFYLTAKASTGDAAFSAARQLYNAGMRLRICSIGARERVCPNAAAHRSGVGGSYCNPEDCPYARGYFTASRQAIAELIGKCAGYSTEVIREAAEKYSVCPYELSLDLSLYCDVTVCDYNYVFDPAISLRRYFECDDGGAERNVFLIDEAHNLPDRVRDTFSVELSANRVRRIAEGAAEAGDGTLCKASEAVVRFLLGLRGLCRDSLRVTSEGELGFSLSREPIAGLADVLSAAVRGLTGWRRGHRGDPLYGEVSAFLSDMKKYLRIFEYCDRGVVSYIEIRGGDTRVKVFCTDPSELIAARLGKARASVLFSATLTPIDYFISLCGGGRESVKLDLPSPFRGENLCLAAVDTLSVKSESRNDATYRRTAAFIAATVSARAGNYICYFPSYAFLERVHKCFSAKYPRVRTVVQKRNMSAAERREFLSAFREDEGVLRVGFCVLGGSFSEGVDLPGSRLIGSIIVGVGLPSLSNERNILAEYYESREPGSGFDYAYAYPGMNSVLQAAGRVIRRDSDRGIVVLIDERYATPEYIRMMPSAWSTLCFAGDPRSLAELAKRFWREG